MILTHISAIEYAQLVRIAQQHEYLMSMVNFVLIMGFVVTFGLACWGAYGWWRCLTAEEELGWRKRHEPKPFTQENLTPILKSIRKKLEEV